MDNRFYTFVGGNTGAWSVVRVEPVVGPSLETPEFLDIKHEFLPQLPAGANWFLRGVVSNQRYTTREEQTQLVATQAPLGRLEDFCAALIPITKNADWWNLTQDERREIFETRSLHTTTGLRYLPAIARRLHHGRDLGEPFDFLTWFEFPPREIGAFEELVAMLRATEEWKYVEREVDIRLVRRSDM